MIVFGFCSRMDSGGGPGGLRGDLDLDLGGDLDLDLGFDVMHGKDRFEELNDMKSMLWL